MEFHEERLGVCFKFVGLQTHLDELGSKFVVVVGVHPRPSTKFGHCRFHFPDHPCIIYIYMSSSISKLEHRSSDVSFCFYRYVIDPALRFLRNWISPSSGKPMRTCRTQASEWQTSLLQATDSAGTFKNRTWQDDPQLDNNVWSLTRAFLGSPFCRAPSGELGESWPAVWSTQPVESNLTAWFSRLPKNIPKTSNDLHRFTYH